MEHKNVKKIIKVIENRKEYIIKLLKNCYKEVTHLKEDYKTGVAIYIDGEIESFNYGKNLTTAAINNGDGIEIICNQETKITPEEQISNLIEELKLDIIDGHGGEKYKFLRTFIKNDDVYYFVEKSEKNSFFSYDTEELYKEFQILWNSLEGETAEEKLGDLFISVVPFISPVNASLQIIFLDVSIAYLLPNIFHFFLTKVEEFSSPVETEICNPISCTGTGICGDRRILKGAEKRKDLFLKKIDQLSKFYNLKDLKEEILKAW